MIPPGEASRLLDIPGTTLRRYSRLVVDYLSPGAHKRKRQYTQRDLDILAQVRDLAARGVPMSEIPSRLDNTIDQGPPRDTGLALPGLLSRMDEIRGQFDQLQDDQQRTSAYLDQLRQWAALPWYKRLFKPPPR